MAHKVVFRKSGVTAEWDDSLGSLLELAEENGVDIEFQCREGFCGSCAVKLVSGEVEMEDDTGLENVDDPEEMILACTAIPITDIVVDA